MNPRWRSLGANASQETFHAALRRLKVDHLVGQGIGAGRGPCSEVRHSGIGVTDLAQLDAFAEILKALTA